MEYQLSNQIIEHNPGFTIGESLPYFCLRGTDGRMYSSNSFQDAKCLAVIFTSNHCPYSRLYEKRIISIFNELHPRGFYLLAICSNDGLSFPEDSFENMQTKNYPFPYLHDEFQQVARSFDAQTTPEVFLFDEDKILRYQGSIDDSPESINLVQTHYLKDAIIAILEKKPVSFPRTSLIGCSIKWRIY